MSAKVFELHNMAVLCKIHTLIYVGVLAEIFVNLTQA